MIRLISIIAERFGIKPKEAERFAKFMMVGTLGFIIDFGTLTLLIELVKLPEMVAETTQFSVGVGRVVANTISFSLAVLSNFTFNRYWTYPESRNRKKRVQLPQFTTVSIIGLVLNNTIFALTTPLFDLIISSSTFVQIPFEGYVPAKILATGVVLFWNFFINRFWTYSNVK